MSTAKKIDKKISALTKQYNKKNNVIEIDRDEYVSLEIGQFFKKHRAAQDIKVSELAKLMRLTEVQLMKFENGKKPLPMQSIYQLINFLNVDPSEALELFYNLSLKK